MDIEALSIADKKTDGVYYEAFTQLQSNTIFICIVQVLKLLTFIALIPVNIKTQNIPYNNLIKCFIVNAVASGLGLFFAILLYFSVLKNVKTFLKLSRQTNHSVQNQIANDQSRIQVCVSRQIYIAQNEVRYADIDQNTKNTFRRITKNNINTVIRQLFGCIKNVQDLYSLLSFGSMIFAIVVLIQEDKPAFDTVILSIYVVVVALTQLPLTLLCIFIALSPLICIVLIICCCCCSSEGSDGQFINIQSKQATTSDLVNAGGDCSICMTSMNVGSKIFVLPCSQKHVFHMMCLKQWARVKNTCPICRAVIPMTRKQRESQVGAESERDRVQDQ